LNGRKASLIGRRRRREASDRKARSIREKPLRS
jgi:hypothetical protein